MEIDLSLPSHDADRDFAARQAEAMAEIEEWLNTCGCGDPECSGRH